MSRDEGRGRLMRIVLKDEQLILAPESEDEERALAVWKAGRQGHVLLAQSNRGTGLCLRDLGAREEVCQEPMQVSSRGSDPGVRLIGNFAETPFLLDGRSYRSVESFWQGLKFADPADRLRVATLHGGAAKKAGETKGYGPTVTYEG